MDSKRKLSKTKRLRILSQRKPILLNQQNDEENSINDSDENALQSTSSSNSRLCRVCLNEGDIPIYGDDSIGDISEALTIHCDIEIHPDDDYPKFLCHDCHEQLQSAIKFKQTAQETDQLLKDRSLPEEPIIFNNNGQTDDKDIKEFKKTLADANTVYYCSQCELNFETSREYGEHMFSEDHTNLKDKCPFCCRVYSCIRKHLTLHKLSETVLCKICGEKFLRPNFWRHRESHQDILPYKCSKCPYQGRYPGDFKIHMRTHTGERPYKCCDCSAGFISKSNLNRHMLTHKRNYNFQCDECAKGFYTQENLDLHIKVSHTGVREHLCSLCGKAYGYRKALMRHLLQVHKREKLRSGKLPVYLRLKSKDHEIVDETHCEISDEVLDTDYLEEYLE